MTEQPHLLVEQDGYVLTLTMNRPDQRNALSTEMVVRLTDAWAQINDDPTIRVAILTGAGGHFSAGADLKAMAGGYGGTGWAVPLRKHTALAWKRLLRRFPL